MLLKLVITWYIINSIGPIEPMQHKAEHKYYTLPIFLSVYDPRLCYPENGGFSINCDSEPEYTAMGYRVSDWYGLASACPEIMMGKSYIFGVAGERSCIDTGGAIKPTYREVYTSEGFVTGWYLVLDMLEPFEEHDSLGWAYYTVPASEWYELP